MEIKYERKPIVDPKEGDIIITNYGDEYIIGRCKSDNLYEYSLIHLNKLIGFIINKEQNEFTLLPAINRLLEHCNGGDSIYKIISRDDYTLSIKPKTEREVFYINFLDKKEKIQVGQYIMNKTKKNNYIIIGYSKNVCSILDMTTFEYKDINIEDIDLEFRASNDDILIKEHRK